VAIERDTPENCARRKAFSALVASVQPEQLVFLDESFCKTGMRREHAWSPRGERVVGRRPGRNWKTVSLLGAIRLGEKPRLMTHRGSINGRTFLQFVRKYLVPWLRPGDVVVMDNLNSHKMKCVRAAIEAAGGIPVYLPTYSPELNPIELWWADMKRTLRKLAIDVESELRRAARQQRARLQLEKIANWFGHSLREAQRN
jgi:transposase